MAWGRLSASLLHQDAHFPAVGERQEVGVGPAYLEEEVVGAGPWILGVGEEGVVQAVL